MKFILKSTKLISPSDAARVTKMQKGDNFDFGYACEVKWQVENKRAVGIMPKSILMDNHELIMPTTLFNYIMVDYKKKVSSVFYVKKHYNVTLNRREGTMPGSGTRAEESSFCQGKVEE